MRPPGVILFVTPPSYTRDRRTVPEDYQDSADYTLGATKKMMRKQSSFPKTAKLMANSLRREIEPCATHQNNVHRFLERSFRLHNRETPKPDKNEWRVDW